MPASLVPAGTEIVRFENVRFSFGALSVFSGLNFAMRAGEHIVLIGENGQGKSTLLRLAAAELRPDQGVPGRIVWNFEGRPDTSPLAAKEFSRLVSPGQQREYRRQGWRLSGEEILLSGLDNAPMLYGRASESDKAKARELASKAGAMRLLSIEAPEMSQGQLRLMLILRALISSPPLLLLDEPYEGLDAEARKTVTPVLLLAASLGSTLCVTTHRAQDISLPSSVTLRLHEGVASPVPAAVEKNNPHVIEPTAPPAPAATGLSDGVFVLELEKADVFIERKKVLHNINWTIRSGEHWVVTGSNGSGKSTLLRLLYGEEFSAYGGSLCLFNGPRMPLDELREQVGFVSDKLQDGYDYDMAAEDIVLSGLRGHIGLYAEPTNAERRMAQEKLAAVGLASAARRNFHSLSTGTARRVLLARALACMPKLLLLDEPCSGLDPQSRRLFLNLLPPLAGQGVTLVMVSHHPEDASELFTRELHLEKGRVTYSGPRR